MKRYFIKLIEYIKQHGFKETIKKIFIILLNKLIYGRRNKKILQEENENYKLWIKNNEPTKEELELQREYKFNFSPKISIVVPMYNTPIKYFKELIESVVNQTYSNLELCLADGSPEKNEEFEDICNKDDRIKYKFLGKNGGISENTNEALKLATGDYIALLDHDDIIPKFALYEIVKCINENPDVEFIFSDEDKIMEDKENRMGPHFKSDYAHDTLLSYNYICHFSIFKKELLERIGGFNKEFDGSQDYDIILRAIENAKKIIHIPKILYHWRINPASVAMSSTAKPYAYEAAKKAIKAHLKRIGEDAEVTDSRIIGLYRLDYKLKEKSKVSIIILNKDHKRDLKKCIDSILKTKYDNYEILIVENNSKDKNIFEYYNKISQNDKIKVLYYMEKENFNYSKLNNFAAKQASGDYLLFLNNDIEIIYDKAENKDWLEMMLAQCQRKDIGIVGAKLLYKNNTIQHAGVVLNFGGVAGHVNAHEPKDAEGYFGRIMIQQNFSAVTGAFLMLSKKDYMEVNGFDEDFPVAYNDIDLCLKITNLGKLVVYNPYITAYHYESKTRGYDISEEKKKRLEEDSERIIKKWKGVFEKYDPYFNVNLRTDVPTMRINTKNN